MNSSKCLLMSYVPMYLSFVVNRFSVDAIRLPLFEGVVLCGKYKQLIAVVTPLYKKVTKQGLQTSSLVSITFPPVRGVPPPAKRLSCGRQCSGLPFRYGHGSYLSVAYATLTPLRAADPCACSHRLGGSTSCLSQPAAQTQAAAIRRFGRYTGVSPPQTKLPQLQRECPALRGLTTTFRSDGQTTAPCLRCRLLAPLQSVVRSPLRTSHTIA